MTALVDWEGASDAALAGAAVSGDRGAFAVIYDRYADRLNDYCIGILRDREAAADCVQETFCTAATRLSMLRDPDKLRPWLYAVSRSQALRHLSRRRREHPGDDEFDTIASDEPEPAELASRDELAGLIEAASGGLSDRDREALELTYRHGLDGPELGAALGVSPATANTLVHRARETIGKSLGALLVARAVRAGEVECAAMAAILADWDGQLTVLMRKRIARHIEMCRDCESERARRVNPKVLLGAPMFIAAPVELRDKTLSQIQLTCAAGTLSGPETIDDRTVGAISVAESSTEHRRRYPVLVGALLAAIVLVGAGVAALATRNNTAEVEPATDVQPVTRTVPPVASTPRATPAAPPTPSEMPKASVVPSPQEPSSAPIQTSAAPPVPVRDNDIPIPPPRPAKPTMKIDWPPPTQEKPKIADEQDAKAPWKKKRKGNRDSGGGNTGGSTGGGSGSLTH